MRLKHNKKEISYGNITKRIYWKESNIMYSTIDIWNKQNIDTLSLINSNELISNIYNEVNRE
jgi:hypothetical protein